jgi:hypothetical protein
MRKHPMNKFDLVKALDIRLNRSKERCDDLAAEFGMSRTSMSLIRTSKAHRPEFTVTLTDAQALRLIERARDSFTTPEALLSRLIAEHEVI